MVIGNSLEECSATTDVLIELLRSLGFYIAWKKVVPASNKVTYLGIQLDSVNMEVSLPDAKLAKLRRLVSDFQGRTSCSLKDLQVLAGSLAHASMVIKGGRTFSRRVINLAKYMDGRSKVCAIPDWMRDDLVWWLNFMQVFNGKAKVVSGLECRFSLETDSSMTGYGAVCGEDWVVGVWRDLGIRQDVWVPEHHVGSVPDLNDDAMDINILELWPVLVGLKRWCAIFKDSKVRLWTDNTQVRQMVNTGRSRSVRCMYWIRELFWICAIYNIHLTASYVRSEENRVPDYLSRLFDARRTGSIPIDLLHFLCCYRDGRLMV